MQTLLVKIKIDNNIIKDVSRKNRFESPEEAIAWRKKQDRKKVLCRVDKNTLVITTKKKANKPEEILKTIEHYRAKRW